MPQTFRNVVFYLKVLKYFLRKEKILYTIKLNTTNNELIWKWKSPKDFIYFSQKKNDIKNSFSRINFRNDIFHQFLSLASVEGNDKKPYFLENYVVTLPLRVNKNMNFWTNIFVYFFLVTIGLTQQNWFFCRVIQPPRFKRPLVRLLDLSIWIIFIFSAEAIFPCSLLFPHQIKK